VALLNIRLQFMKCYITCALDGMLRASSDHDRDFEESADRTTSEEDSEHNIRQKISAL
jgi:hypothetical protein